jgi:tellurite resistance protein TerA
MAIDYTKKPSAPAPPAGQPINTTKPAAAAPPPQAAPSGPTVSLGKVTLTKSAPAVSLSKGGPGGVLRVNLNWTARPADAPGAKPEKGGFLKRMAATAMGGGGAIDLDLGALYEYSDGSKGVVQALGNAFRDIHTFGPAPIVRLDGDDRSGTNTAGENLFVDLAQERYIRRILVFAFIYQGVPNWAAADAVVTLFPTSGPQIEVRLDESDNQAPMCAIAMLSNTGSGLSVNREVRYIRGGQSHLDQAYGWGMQWAKGSK